MRVTGVVANLPVADIAAARDFYTDYLGLSVEGFNLGWVARYQSPDGNAVVQLVTGDATAPEDSVISVHVGADVDEAYEEAKRRGDLEEASRLQYGTLAELDARLKAENERLAVGQRGWIVTDADECEQGSKPERSPRDAVHDGAAHGEILRLRRSSLSASADEWIGSGETGRFPSMGRTRAPEEKRRKLRQSGERRP